MTRQVTPKVIVGALGRLRRTQAPEPDHSVVYPPWMHEALTVKKARAAVRTGTGPRRKVIKGSRWA